MALTKKDLEKIKDVIDESLDNKISQMVKKVLEPYFTAIQQDFNRNFEDHKIFNNNLEEITTGIRSLKQSLASLENKLLAIDGALTEHRQDIREIISNIKELRDSDGITRKQIFDLNRRLSEFEAAV
jgi:chromosome segregation ATPase